ncbi:hypothetical protein [Rubricoccus marinus]|uniref:DUF5683 domain-containing protein n=1 Tax=Rubricoccus marinus TaxID=716817 RepID=A0A259U2U2_9BACT|nr:hypothetical protein [Rubricoccus marinus]OZC04363.1 hypothetical protein BSZ36_16080 [Rubricoccus marinus]
MRCLLLALSLLLASGAAAQSPKEPVRAQLYSFMAPGGGQFYAGETVKGAVLLAGAVVGLAVAATEIDDLTRNVPDRGYYTTHGTRFGVGLGTAGVLWLYGIIDAPNAARRANRRSQLTVLPRPDGGATVALRVGL